MTPTNTVTDAETRVRKGLVCSNVTFECAHGDHYLNGSDVAELLASLATLREERDALLAEKARLDWLEKFAETGAGLYAESNSDSFDWDSRKGGAFRQAIDAARAAHQGTEP